jgi:hypothetical protein
MNNKNRKHLTRLTSMAVFIAILIAVITYNYYIMEETKLSDDSFNNTLRDRIETTKVGMIYPTKIGGDGWFMDPARLKEDKRFDANAYLTRPVCHPYLKTCFIVLAAL